MHNFFKICPLNIIYEKRPHLSALLCECLSAIEPWMPCIISPGLYPDFHPGPDHTVMNPHPNICLMLEFIEFLMSSSMTILGLTMPHSPMLWFDAASSTPPTGSVPWSSPHTFWNPNLCHMGVSVIAQCVCVHWYFLILTSSLGIFALALIASLLVTLLHNGCFHWWFGPAGHLFAFGCSLWFFWNIFLAGLSWFVSGKQCSIRVRLGFCLIWGVFRTLPVITNKQGY